MAVLRMRFFYRFGSKWYNVHTECEHFGVSLAGQTHTGNCLDDRCFPVAASAIYIVSPKSEGFCQICSKYRMMAEAAGVSRDYSKAVLICRLFWEAVSL